MKMVCSAVWRWRAFVIHLLENVPDDILGLIIYLYSHGSNNYKANFWFWITVVAMQSMAYVKNVYYIFCCVGLILVTWGKDIEKGGIR
jgi:hypothetical protein